MRRPVRRRGRHLWAGWLGLLAAIAGCGDGGAPSDATGSTGRFSITVRFIDSTPPSASLQSAFAHATTRWQRVIVDSVGSIPITLAAGRCDSVQPAINERVKDLLVLVHIREIQDTVPGQAILGESGPCLVRNPGNIPILGIMSLNSSTLASIDSSGLLDDVILHEMGHLLGFGTVWDLDGLVHDTTTDDPWFSGANAQAAFHRALPVYSDKIVPVEAGGGEGTTFSHWRESVMGNELMTGFLNQGPNPLSAITVESMADLGYTVSEAAADPWPSTSSSARAEARAASVGGMPRVETTVTRPRYWVTGSGQVSPIFQPGLRLH